jgi:tRNA1Val (adenine37-N6)-methyltransferase
LLSERPLLNDYQQPEGGYHFSRDSILLAEFTPAEMPGRAADLGAGCGVVGLEALAQGRLKNLSTLYLVEARAIFWEPLLENARLSSRPWGPNIKPIMADWRHLSPESLGGPLDYLMVNPPYFPVGSSGQPKLERHLARHETLGDLDDLFLASLRLLANKGGLAISWPRSRLADLIKAASKAGFSPIRYQLPPWPGNSLILAEFTS